MSRQDILRAYRHLGRAALRAVRYSTPARYQVRDILREQFRVNASDAFVPRRIQNTLEFLESAAEHTGMQHKILKNILLVRYWKYPPKLNSNKLPGWMRQNTDIGVDLRRNTWKQFDATLALFNESADLCLRV